MVANMGDKTYICVCQNCNAENQYRLKNYRCWNCQKNTISVVMKRPDYVAAVEAGELVVEEVNTPAGKRTREEVFKSARPYVQRKEEEKKKLAGAEHEDKKGNPKYSEDYGRNRVKD